MSRKSCLKTVLYFCSVFYVGLVTAQVGNNLNVEGLAGEDRTTCPTTSVSIGECPPGNFTFNWTSTPFDNSLNPNVLNQLVNPEETTVYTLALYGEGCNPCTDDVIVKVIDPDITEEYLLSQGFHEIHDGLEFLPALTSDDNSSRSVSEGLYDFTNGAHQTPLDVLANIYNLYSSDVGPTIAILSNAGDYCDGDIEEITHLIDLWQNDRVIVWHHILVDPSSGEERLFEWITDDDYDEVMEVTVFSSHIYYDGGCSENLRQALMVNDLFIPCHGTKRVGRSGSLDWTGTLEHWLIELEYVCLLHAYKEAKAEYFIPGSSATGNNGYVDIANEATRELFEIKKFNLATQGTTEITNYVNVANIECKNPLDPPWIKGLNYPPYQEFPNLRGPGILKVTFNSQTNPGVILYETLTNVPVTDPVNIPIPGGTWQRLVDKINQWKTVLGTVDIELEIAKFLHENPEIAYAVAGALYSAALTIVVATILEDILTLGAGIADDVASFVIAWRLVKIARVVVL